jgi:hypothetical protein
MQPAAAEMTPSFVVDTLGRERTVWVRERTDSMAPLVRAGDRLQLASADRRHIHPGTLVAFRSGAVLVVHRVLGCDVAGVVTKGDALPHRDQPVPWAAVVARVIAVAHRDRVRTLDRFPWPAVGRALAAASRVAEAVAPAPPGRAWWRRPAWRLARLPAHLVAWIAR